MATILHVAVLISGNTILAHFRLAMHSAGVFVYPKLQRASTFICSQFEGVDSVSATLSPMFNVILGSEEFVSFEHKNQFTRMEECKACIYLKLSSNKVF